jgi:hypothetical protein
MPAVGDTQAQQETDRILLSGMQMLAFEYERCVEQQITFKPTYELFAKLLNRSKCMLFNILSSKLYNK